MVKVMKLITSSLNLKNPDLPDDKKLNFDIWFDNNTSLNC